MHPHNEDLQKQHIEVARMHKTAHAWQAHMKVPLIITKLLANNDFCQGKAWLLRVLDSLQLQESCNFQPVHSLFICTLTSKYLLFARPIFKCSSYLDLNVWLLLFLFFNWVRKELTNSWSKCPSIGWLLSSSKKPPVGRQNSGWLSNDSWRLNSETKQKYSNVDMRKS